MNSLVSIIIPAFNAEKYIEETIHSVVYQTYTNWELLIIDDGSTDATKEIVISFTKNNNKIKYYYHNNRGVSYTRNRGISLSKGSYIAFLDADDIWEPYNLKIKISELEKNPNIDYVFSNMNLLIQKNNVWYKNSAPPGTDKDMLNHLLLWDKEVIPCLPSNVIIRKNIIDKYNLFFDERLSTAADRDYAILLSLHARGKFLESKSLNYRITPGSMSKNIDLMENDFLYLYRKIDEMKLLHPLIFKCKCYSNLYLILSGSFYKDAKNVKKSLFYLIKSIAIYPLQLFHILLKIISKLKAKR